MRLTVQPQILPANASLNKASDCGGVSVYPRGFFFDVVHGAYFSPCMPLNTTQQIGAPL